jgi:hypothetical protein
MLESISFYLTRQATNWQRYLLEQLILFLVGWIPPIIGIGIRGIVYRLILEMEGLVAIENGVRLRMYSKKN